MNLSNAESVKGLFLSGVINRDEARAALEIEVEPVMDACDEQLRILEDIRDLIEPLRKHSPRTRSSPPAW